jgi:hypothetical protein
MPENASPLFLPLSKGAPFFTEVGKEKSGAIHCKKLESGMVSFKCWNK